MSNSLSLTDQSIMSHASKQNTYSMQGGGIKDLIKSLSSPRNKRSSSLLYDNADYSSGLTATAKLHDLAHMLKRRKVNNGLQTDTSYNLTDPDILSGFALFSQLKLANRKIQQSNKAMKERIKEKRVKVDERYLTLKKRQAELQSLNNQISAQRRYSEIIEEVDLISENEFDEKAREHNYVHTNSHEKMLNRLNLELEQRKNLHDQLQELGKMKSRINLHSSNFKKDFVKIKNLAGSFTHACTPLNNAINKLKFQK